MKKYLLLFLSTMVTVFMMAAGDGKGSTQANAIEFDWENGHEQAAGAKWYRVDLARLKQEEKPSLSLYLTNPDRAKSVDVTLEATLFGEKQSKKYTIEAHQNRSWSANATLLKRMEDVYIYLESTGRIKLSARVFEASELDETCDKAAKLSWTTDKEQTPGYAAWWKVDLTPVRDDETKDARFCLTNAGSGPLRLVMGQSYDCPSSGLTNRTLYLAAGETMYDTIPGKMLRGLESNDLYLSLENDQPLRFHVELINTPVDPVISGPYEDLHVTDTKSISAGTHLYRLDVREMNNTEKYEPEFTFRNEGSVAANMITREAYVNPAYSAVKTMYEIAAKDEEIIVYKKNMLDGLNPDSVPYIFLQVTTDQPLQLTGRYKYVREGKFCKANIDFDWEKGHRQAARTTQWYQVVVTDAKKKLRDIKLTIENEGTTAAKIDASVAFSCKDDDLYNTSRTINAGSKASKVITYSTYALFTDTVWIGVTTNQQIRISADTIPTTVKTPNDKCLVAKEFKWLQGEVVTANDSVWYKIGLDSMRNRSEYPTIYVRNRSTVNAAKIYAELSLDCPDSTQNDSRKLTIAAGDVYTKKLARTMFTHFDQDTVYLLVHSTEELSIELRLTEEAEGESCTSAVEFKWGIGNDQPANANQWYAVDLKEAMQTNKDVKVTIVNKDNVACKGSAWMIYTCPSADVQTINFSLAAKGAEKSTKSKTIPHSMLETLSGSADSVIYIRLIGNTALHVEAELVTPAHFDTIFCEGLALQPLDWNTVYTQTTDTAWYLLDKATLQILKDSASVTAQAYVRNLAGVKNKIKAEIAYHCPITSRMMSKAVEIQSGDSLLKIIERNTADLVAGKDSVLIRITSSAYPFEFGARLVSPYTGNDRMHAVRVTLGEKYQQEANTAMWYKFVTADWKADQSLHGKSLLVQTKNEGGAAKIGVEVYEDVSTENLLDGITERKVSAGKSASRHIPAYAVYGLGDVEIYVKVTSDQPLSFSTSLSDYATLTPPDPTQADAQLAVPNVEYTIPAGQPKWYAVCVPYIRNNYKLAENSIVEFQNPNAADAKVTVTATWQNPLSYKVPERTRTIKAGKSYTKTFREIVAKGAKKAGVPNIFENMSINDIDSLLRLFLTSDSLTAYVRVESDQPLIMKVTTPQTTGDACTNAMVFDWEHGNVNPAGNTTWFKVLMDSTRIPDTCDLRLHVENWSLVNNSAATAKVYFDCLDAEPTTTINQTLDPNQDKFKDIDRDLIKTVGGWANMLINYTSAEDTRIWVELVPKKPRGQVFDTIPMYMCNGEDFLDTITGINHTIDSLYPETLTWNDTVEFLNDTAAAMWDSITTFKVVPRVDPILYKIDTVANLLVIKRGQVIDCSAATQWLKDTLERDRIDSIKYIDTIIWQWSTNGTDFEPIPTTPIVSENFVLRYVAVTECEKDTIVSDEFTRTIRDTLQVETCKASYTWDDPTPVRTYTKSILDSVGYSLSLCDSVAYLDLTITGPTKGAPQVQFACGSYKWAANDSTYTQSTLDSCIILTADGLCDSLAYLDLTMGGLIKGDTLHIDTCGSYKWAANDSTYTVSTLDSVIVKTILDCDSMIFLDLTIGGLIKGDTLHIDTCQAYKWAANDSTYTVSTLDSVIVKTTLGCDSMIFLDLTIGGIVKGDTTTIVECKSFKWTANDSIYTATTLDSCLVKSATGCPTRVYLDLTITGPVKGTPQVELVCDTFKWAANGKTYSATTLDSCIIPTADGLCDSLAYLDLTIRNKWSAISIAELTGKPFVQRGQPIDVSAWETELKAKLADSIAADATLAPIDTIIWEWSKDGTNFEALPQTATPTEAVSIRYVLRTECEAVNSDQYNNTAVDSLVLTDICNSYDAWSAKDTIYYESTRDTVLLKSATNPLCDSLACLSLTIDNPVRLTLKAVSKYGNRLLMIHRNDIMDKTGWDLDSIAKPEEVKWYKGLTKNDPNPLLVDSGYYIVNRDSGSMPLPDGWYYAVIELKPDSNHKCGSKGYTEPIECASSNKAAPALMPSLARPGEDITVINLDPEHQSLIRIYSTQGLVLNSYTVQGEETFTIKAANEHGFYLVEITEEDMKSTLRYIVK